MKDFLVFTAPVSRVPPFPHHEDLKGYDRVRHMLHEQSLLYGSNLLGLLAVVVPSGLHQGAPIGVRIIGQRFRVDPCEFFQNLCFEEWSNFPGDLHRPKI